MSLYSTHTHSQISSHTHLTAHMHLCHIASTVTHLHVAVANSPSASVCFLSPLSLFLSLSVFLYLSTKRLTGRPMLRKANPGCSPQIFDHVIDYILCVCRRLAIWLPRLSSSDVIHLQWATRSFLRLASSPVLHHLLSIYSMLLWLKTIPPSINFLFYLLPFSFFLSSSLPLLHYISLLHLIPFHYFLRRHHHLSLSLPFFFFYLSHSCLNRLHDVGQLFPHSVFKSQTATEPHDSSRNRGRADTGGRRACDQRFAGSNLCEKCSRTNFQLLQCFSVLQWSQRGQLLVGVFLGRQAPNVSTEERKSQQLRDGEGNWQLNPIVGQEHQYWMILQNLRSINYCCIPSVMEHKLCGK